MTETPARPTRRARWVRGALVLATLFVGVHLVWAAYLWTFASEGALPPRWRIPDAPAGATVVSAERGCASGTRW